MNQASRSIPMGTLLGSFRSYGATRSRSPVPQTAVSLASATALVSLLYGLSHFFSSQDDRPKIVCKSRIPSTPPQTPLVTYTRLEDNRIRHRGDRVYIRGCVYTTYGLPLGVFSRITPCTKSCMICGPGMNQHTAAQNVIYGTSLPGVY